MKAYLDNSVVSSFARNDNPKESDAILQLSNLHKADKLDLVTSSLTLEEIRKLDNVQNAAQDRWILQIVYNLLKDVPHVEDLTLVGFHNDWHRYGGVSNPLFEEHPISKNLREIGLDRMDAYHLMQAIYNECDIFVTCDVKTILRYCVEIQKQFSAIRLLKPSELVGQLI
jgi:predicted nucleic acid-binding protein